MKTFFTLNMLRIFAVTTVAAGTLGSLILVLHAGRHNQSVLLPVLFAGWVLSPFAAIAAAIVTAKRWPELTRIAVYWLAIVLAIGSLLFYSGTLNLNPAKPAFIFLVVPLVSWALIGITIPVTVVMERRRERK